MRYRRLVLVVLAGLLVLGAAAVAAPQPPDAGECGELQESFALWLLRSLGLWGHLSILVAAALFIGSCVVVRVAQRPAVIAAYAIFLPLPLLLAVAGELRGMLAASAVIARSNTQLRASEAAQVQAETVVLPASALIATLPSYLVVAVGLFARTVAARPGQAGPPPRLDIAEPKGSR
jgi:hypothetical protein